MAVGDDAFDVALYFRALRVPVRGCGNIVGEVVRRDRLLSPGSRYAGGMTVAENAPMQCNSTCGVGPKHPERHFSFVGAEVIATTSPPVVRSFAPLGTAA